MSTAFTNLQAIPIDSALPSQSTSTNGKALISNGTNSGWNTILSMIGPGAGQTPSTNVANAILPNQAGSSGKILSTDGAGNLTWISQANIAGVSSVTVGANVYTGAVTINSVPTAVNVTGTVAIANGGTGATTASGALTNLGAAATNHTHNYAPTISPAFTGTPTAPTAAAGTSSSQIATTAFVQSAVVSSGVGSYAAVYYDGAHPGYGNLVPLSQCYWGYENINYTLTNPVSTTLSGTWVCRGGEATRFVNLGSGSIFVGQLLIQRTA